MVTGRCEAFLKAELKSRVTFEGFSKEESSLFGAWRRGGARDNLSQKNISWTIIVWFQMLGPLVSKCTSKFVEQDGLLSQMSRFSNRPGTG